MTRLPNYLTAPLMVAVVMTFSASPVQGQLTSFRQSLRNSGSARQKREAEFRELASEVKALEPFTNVLKQVVQLATPSVVHIESSRIEPAGRRYASSQKIEEAGSGVLVEIDDRIFALTNRHVILGARLPDIRIQLADGRSIQAARVDEHPGTDIAVISLTDPDLVPARRGDSGKMEIGDIVLAMGSPFGLSHSVTFGIISAKGRRDLDLGRQKVSYQDFMQTDAAINPGNSGGPLLNLNGEVVGLNTAIASNSGGNEGIGFAIPMNMVMVVAEQLVRNGHVSHAYLGVTLDNNFDADTAFSLGVPGRRGALVKAITDGSPAALAKILPNDIILRFNGTKVDNDTHLVNLVGLTQPTRPVVLEVFREGQVISLPVTLTNRSRFEE